MPRKSQFQGNRSKPSLHTRCQLLNAAIREGVIVEANIKGTPRVLIGMLSNVLGVTLLFRDEDNNTVMFEVDPKSPLEFVVTIPRDEKSQPSPDAL